MVGPRFLSFEKGWFHLKGPECTLPCQYPKYHETTNPWDERREEEGVLDRMRGKTLESMPSTVLPTGTPDSSGWEEVLSRPRVRHGTPSGSPGVESLRVRVSWLGVSKFSSLVRIKFSRTHCNTSDSRLSDEKKFQKLSLDKESVIETYKKKRRSF